MESVLEKHWRWTDPVQSHRLRGLTPASSHSPPESRDDNSVHDLFDLIQVPKKNHGVTLVKGDDPYSPAYKILNPDLIPPVPESAFRDLIDLHPRREGIPPAAQLQAVQADPGEPPHRGEAGTAPGPVFEIVSNGKANTLDIVFSTENKQQVVVHRDVDLAHGSLEEHHPVSAGGPGGAVRGMRGGEHRGAGCAHPEHPDARHSAHRAAPDWEGSGEGQVHGERPGRSGLETV